MKFKKSLVIFHKYVGVVLAVHFVLLGLTGSVLVWDHEIDVMLNPDLLLHSHSDDQQSFSPPETLIEAGKSILNSATDCTLDWPRGPVEVFVLYCDALNSQGNLSSFQVYLQPITAEVLGSRDTNQYGINGRDIMHTVYAIHDKLLIGEAGFYIVGISGLFLLSMAVSGIILWWPQNLRLLKAALTVSKSPMLMRKLFDLHRVFGFYGVTFLIAASFTGVSLALPDEFEWAFCKVVTCSDRSFESLASESSITLDTAPNNLSDALEIAKRTLDAEAQITGMSDPLLSPEYYKLTFIQGKNLRQSDGTDEVLVPKTTTDPIMLIEESELPFDEWFYTLLFTIHNGEVFGFFGRVLISVVGLLPLILAVTGCWIWLKKRRPPKRRPRVISRQT